MLRIVWLAALLLCSCSEVGPGPGTSKADAEKAEVLRIIKANVEDPTGLEIVSWGTKAPNPAKVADPDYRILRTVRFRCKLVGHEVTERGARVPVMLDDAKVYYADSGKIIFIQSEKTGDNWRAK